ncbi:MAG: hypothetical protein HLUCCA05_02595 [Roseibaca calidilacus]|uniref:Flagellar assembly protein T, N-terminal domain n=1 Tax=Roseibaca calidilacus TaxID=1666912 RepID=A0A0P7WWB7_9RHOB|nr:flagellar assembly protein T N-terminal domain-containing protein [Roseibaca calidilacus]KPP95566.1 MAG: hypothetical protein HLUCCA05_02595 [Roseibaca calidilacus]CUX82081.1 Flagellar assembly protein T, N-terminal domain [Roseibaca calidilacus]
MSRLSRRSLLMAAFAVPLLPHAALAGVWVEVTGSAIIHNAADHDAARRRALADALLAAAFAGGANVQGHSAMSLGRMTSDMLVVRPVGQILRVETLSQSLSGDHWLVRIRAMVGAATPTACPGRRALVLTVYPPRLHVAPQAPAWAEALAHDLAGQLLDQLGQQRDVAELHLARATPSGNPDRDATDWTTLTQGSTHVAPGGHGLHLDMRIAPEARELVLHLNMRLDGPGGEQTERRHRAEIRMPGPSLLGRAATLAQPDRHQMAHRLGAGAVPALRDMLRDAGCQPPRAVITQDMRVPLGRVHGLTRTSLGFTADRDDSLHMLEITKLSDRSARLSPLDPTLANHHFTGRAVRFVQSGPGWD